MKHKMISKDSSVKTPYIQKPEGHRAGYVAIIGRPNAGKSTLLNALLGRKLSIVSHMRQSTRSCISGIVSEEKFQMILFDTPGVIERTRNHLERKMMRAVKTSIRNADCIIAVIDATDRPDEALASIQPGRMATAIPFGIILNKVDLIPLDTRNSFVEYIRQNWTTGIIFECSALKQLGLKNIKTWIISTLPFSPELYPKELLADRPESFFVSELIRENIFELYSQEVPYCCQVNVVEFKDQQPPLKTQIYAEIWVEKNGQRGIIIGCGGTMIKQLLTISRRSIEKFLHRPVYLSARVKVLPNWRQNAELLANIGY